MSIINQMLLDLDKRRASGVERGALPNQVRALPRSSKPNYPWRSVAMVTGAVLIALVGWQLGRQPWLGHLSSRTTLELPAQTSQPAAPVLQTPQPAPVPNVTIPAAAVATQPAAVAAETQQPLNDRASRAKAAADARAASAAARSRVAAAQTVPAAPPVSTASVLAAPSPVEAASKPALPPVVAATGARSAGAPPAVAPVTPKPAVSAARGDADSKSKAAGSGQIDKRSQELTAREVAENEYRAGATLLSQGRSAEAQDKFRIALQEFPAHAGARQGLFGLLVAAKRTNEAEHLLHEGLRANPNQPGLAMALARMQVDRGDTPAAVETLQKTAGSGQGSADYLAFLAALQQRQSRHSEAVENYHAALRLAPQSGVWWMGLGISLQALNRNPDAQDAFRRAKSSNVLSAELLAFVDQRLKQLQ